MHRLANRVICEGLVKAGIIVGDVDELIKHHVPALFFPHGLGHMLGLDGNPLISTLKDLTR